MTIHAHVNKESRDCDGRYSHDYTLTPDDDQDDHAFKVMVLGFFAPLDNAEDDENVRVTFTPFGFHLSERTEEGYESTEVEWCNENDSDRAGTFRDHTAESMGY